MLPQKRKLDDCKEREVAGRHVSGESLRSLALDYDISHTTVRNIYEKYRDSGNIAAARAAAALYYQRNPPNRPRVTHPASTSSEKGSHAIPAIRLPSLPPTCYFSPVHGPADARITRPEAGSFQRGLHQLDTGVCRQSFGTPSVWPSQQPTTNAPPMSQPCAEVLQPAFLPCPAANITPQSFGPICGQQTRRTQDTLDDDLTQRVRNRISVLEDASHLLTMLSNRGIFSIPILKTMQTDDLVNNGFDSTDVELLLLDDGVWKSKFQWLDDFIASLPEDLKDDRITARLRVIMRKAKEITSHQDLFDKYELLEDLPLPLKSHMDRQKHASASSSDLQLDFSNGAEAHASDTACALFEAEESDETAPGQISPRTAFQAARSNLSPSSSPPMLTQKGSEALEPNGEDARLLLSLRDDSSVGSMHPDPDMHLKLRNNRSVARSSRIEIDGNSLPMPEPRELVRVLFKKQLEWFQGTVRSFNRTTSKGLIEFDDDTKSEFKLGDPEVFFLPTEASRWRPASCDASPCTLALCSFCILCSESLNQSAKRCCARCNQSAYCLKCYRTASAVFICPFCCAELARKGRSQIPTIQNNPDINSCFGCGNVTQFQSNGRRQYTQCSDCNAPFGFCCSSRTSNVTLEFTCPGCIGISAHDAALEILFQNASKSVKAITCGKKCVIGGKQTTRNPVSAGNSRDQSDVNRFLDEYAFAFCSLQETCQWNLLEKNIPVAVNMVQYQVDRQDDPSIGPFNLLNLMGMKDGPSLELVQNASKLYAAHAEQRAMSFRSGGKFKPGILAKNERTGSESGMRIGYVTADMRRSPWWQLSKVQLLELAQTDSLFIYSRPRIMLGNDPHFIALLKHCTVIDFDERDSDRAMADRIRQDRLDVLIDAGGPTHGSCTGVITLLPEILRGAHLGYPGTQPGGHINFTIVDQHVMPPDEPQAEEAEEALMFMRCYQPNDSFHTSTTVESPPVAQTTRSDWNLPDNAFVFACFCRNGRISPGMRHTFVRILQRVENGVLWLRKTPFMAVERVKHFFSENQIPEHRVVFAPDVPNEQHRERLRHVNLALDSQIYCGHTTCSDNLLGGVPYLALEGEWFQARVAVSLVRNMMGDAAFVCRNLLEFEEKAVHLATAAGSHELKQHSEILREKLALRTGICDGGSWVADFRRGLEAFITQGKPTDSSHPRLKDVFLVAPISTKETKRERIVLMELGGPQPDSSREAEKRVQVSLEVDEVSCANLNTAPGMQFAGEQALTSEDTMPLAGQCESSCEAKDVMPEDLAISEASCANLNAIPPPAGVRPEEQQSGEDADHDLTAPRLGPSGCVDLSRFRRVVVHPQHLDAIQSGRKGVEFRSTAVALHFIPGLRLLFCLGARYRRLGMDTMVVAEVVEVVDLPIGQACRRFASEAQACCLRHMARKWRSGLVRCVVLAKARLDHDYINLSAGCLGFVGQFQLGTGTPRFCHRNDLGKSVRVPMSRGKTALCPLIRSWPKPPSTHDCNCRRLLGKEAPSAPHQQVREVRPGGRGRGTCASGVQGNPAASCAKSRSDRPAGGQAGPKRPRGCNIEGGGGGGAAESQASTAQATLEDESGQSNQGSKSGQSASNTKAEKHRLQWLFDLAERDPHQARLDAHEYLMETMPAGRKILWVESDGCPGGIMPAIQLPCFVPRISAKTGQISKIMTELPLLYVSEPVAECGSGLYSGQTFEFGMYMTGYDGKLVTDPKKTGVTYQHAISLSYSFQQIVDGGQVPLAKLVELCSLGCKSNHRYHGSNVSFARRHAWRSPISGQAQSVYLLAKACRGKVHEELTSFYTASAALQYHGIPRFEIVPGSDLIPDRQKCNVPSPVQEAMEALRKFAGLDLLAIRGSGSQGVVVEVRHCNEKPFVIKIGSRQYDQCKRLSVLAEAAVMDLSEKQGIGIVALAVQKQIGYMEWKCGAALVEASGSLIAAVAMQRADSDARGLWRNISDRFLQGHDADLLRDLCSLLKGTIQVASWMHRSGLAHGDLKPDNVLLIKLDARPTDQRVAFCEVQAVIYQIVFADWGHARWSGGNGQAVHAFSEDGGKNHWYTQLPHGTCPSTVNRRRGADRIEALQPRQLNNAFGLRLTREQLFEHPGHGTVYIRAPGYDKRFQLGQGAEQRRFDQAADMWAVGAVWVRQFAPPARAAAVDDRFRLDEEWAEKLGDASHVADKQRINHAKCPSGRGAKLLGRVLETDYSRFWIATLVRQQCPPNFAILRERMSGPHASSWKQLLDLLQRLLRHDSASRFKADEALQHTIFGTEHPFHSVSADSTP